MEIQIYPNIIDYVVMAEKLIVNTKFTLAEILSKYLDGAIKWT